MGLVGAFVLILALSFLVLRIFRIARAAFAHERWFAAYLATGVGALLGIQALINLGVSTGLLPTKGLTLPFVSFGGHSLIACCLMLGMVLRVAADNEVSDA